MNDEMLSLEALLLARGYLYEIFHKTMGGDPMPELVAALAAPETLDAVDEYADAGEAMAKLRAFLAALAARTGDDGARVAFANHAKDEYTRLFVGPNTLPAQPIETPYVTHEMTLFSKNSLVVRRTYGVHGWQPVCLNHVPDDHVALLCDFMARLAAEALAAFRARDWDALRASAAEQGMFAAGHLLNWLPEFARLQSRVPNPVLYPQLSAALAEFVQLDVAFLSETMAWVAERSGEVGDGCAGDADASEAIDAGVRASSGSNAGDSSVEEASAELSPAFERPESFARLEVARAKLQAMRLFGLEDCELCEASNPPA